MVRLYGGIEAGGTKFVCAVGTGPDDIQDEIRFATGQPQETMARAIDFLLMHSKPRRLAGVGIASFGPIDSNPASPRYGQVLATVKPGWSHTDVVTRLRTALDVPVGFDTDVNGAALAESRWGAGRGCATFVYVTVGTGVGGAVVIDGKVHHGLTHPEMGHMRISHDIATDPYPGSVLSIGIAGRDWPVAPPSRRGGDVVRATFPQTIQHGSWRSTIWPRAWPTSSCCCHHTVSPWVGASWSRRTSCLAYARN